MFIPVIICTFWAFLALVFLDPFVMLVPSFDSIHCSYDIIMTNMRTHNFDFAYQKWQITTNKIVLITVNFIEIAYMYYIWVWMKKIKSNQFNIKNELVFTIVCWILMQLLYLIITLGYDPH